MFLTCAGAHLGKGCASSKESSGFSKMRTFEKSAHLRRGVRTFGRAAALGDPLAGAVPISRKVALALVAASIACLETFMHF